MPHLAVIPPVQVVEGHLSGSKECFRKYENSGGLTSHAVESIEPTERVSLESKEGMARTITHAGYTIESTPHETDGSKWRLHIRISQKDHQGVQTSEFPAQVLCASEQEADIHGIAFGQRIIDGKVKGMSVMDLKPEDRRAPPGKSMITPGD